MFNLKHRKIPLSVLVARLKQLYIKTNLEEVTFFLKRSRTAVHVLAVLLVQVNVRE
jgi:hypothetical protein